MDIMLRTPFLAVRCPVFVSPEKYSSVLLGDVAYRAANPSPRERFICRCHFKPTTYFELRHWPSVFQDVVFFREPSAAAAHLRRNLR